MHIDIFHILNQKALYLILIAASGGLIIWFINRVINKFKESTQTRLKEVENEEMIRKGAPTQDLRRKAKRDVKESHETSFSVVRRTLFTLLYVFFLALFFLPFLGKIPGTLISFLIAATTVVIGIASKPFVENLISGFVLTLSKQLSVGDTVKIDEFYGKIEDISPTHTILKIWDWKRFVIPNSKMIQKEIIRYTNKEKFIWACVEFWVSPESDIDQVKTIAIDCASDCSVLANEEEPRFWVMDCQKDAVKCWVAAWTKSPSDAWTYQNQTRTALIKEFRNNNIKTHAYHLKGVPA